MGSVRGPAPGRPATSEMRRFRPVAGPQANGQDRPRLCENSNDWRESINFSRFSAGFRHYRLGEAKKFASDAPFSDNFRVFTQPGSKPVVYARGASSTPRSHIKGMTDTIETDRRVMSTDPKAVVREFATICAATQMAHTLYLFERDQHRL